MIELVPIIFITLLANGTEVDENDDGLPDDNSTIPSGCDYYGSGNLRLDCLEYEDDPNCIADYYGPGPTNDLLERGHLECASDKCLENGYDSSTRDLLSRDPRCS
jgi:hypothetical protein